MRQMKWMLPKADFNKLRKMVLDNLRINSQANGHGRLAHDGSLRNFSTVDFKPFNAMSPVEVSSATQYFWDYLVKTKDVQRYQDASGFYYHLPGYPPFAASVMAMFPGKSG